MNRINVVIVLSLILVPGLASAKATTLSNKDLADFIVSIGTPDAPPAGRSGIPATGRAAGIAAPVVGAATATPQAAVAIPAEKPRARPTSRAAMVAEAMTVPTAPAPSPSALPRRVVLHLGKSADIVISWASSSAMRDMRVDAETGSVELRVSGNTISIKAPGITGISFER